jgi:GR25 family glycosyltransferase involved in LPS biosynthesis
MKTYAIYIPDNETSERGLEELKLSTNKQVLPYVAVPVDEVERRMNEYGLRWNYPWEGQEFELFNGVNGVVGLTKTAYPTRHREARISCALSHYALWGLCESLQEPIMILEHDAIFLREFDEDLLKTDYNIIGINDPRGATRRSKDFHMKIQLSSGGPVIPVPQIDEMDVPQGLAGNSAYVIKPEAASHLLRLVQTVGLWPNDAIMCQQLVPKMGVTTEYYTKVQGLRSTTT